jgi:hypothetical protein
MVGRENCFQFLHLLFRVLSLVTLPLLALYSNSPTNSSKLQT